MKIAILGFGREGKAVLKFLKKSPEYKKAEVFILDQKLNKPPHQTRMGVFNAKKIKSLLWCGGKDYLKNLDKFDIIFRSPGIPYNLPNIQKAIKKGVIFSSATDLFFKNAKKIGCKIIGITGTKGKGTTSTLLYRILKAANKDIYPHTKRKLAFSMQKNKYFRYGVGVYLAGNIGKPAIEILPKLNKKSVVIFELSSFQLHDLKYSPDIAVVLNIFEDHLDSHKSFKEYVESKANIAKWQKKSDKIFYDASNKWSLWIAQKSSAQKIPINYKIQNKYENTKLQNKLLKFIKIPGEHNLKNVVMATAVAKSMGISEKIILKTIKNYRCMEHRLELVHSNILENIGMNFYNDSASTNPYTAVAAIRAFPNQLKILIAGGKDKNLDYSPLADALKNSNTKLIILFGENKNKIAKAIKNSGVQIKLVKDLKFALNFAYNFSKKLLKSNVNGQASNVNIIFSPASASFDMFKDYKDRGEKFKEIIKALK